MYLLVVDTIYAQHTHKIIITNIGKKKDRRSFQVKGLTKIKRESFLSISISWDWLGQSLERGLSNLQVPCKPVEGDMHQCSSGHPILRCIFYH